MSTPRSTGHPSPQALPDREDSSTEPLERTALHHLYGAKQSEGIPPFLQDLYPEYLRLRHYLGTGQRGCRWTGPGYYYEPSGFEIDCPLNFGLEIHWPDATDGQDASPESPPTRTALYRLRDSSGLLLYVGISEDPYRRWTEHSKDKPWWPQVGRHDIEWLDSREQAAAAELAAIKSERPLFNAAGAASVMLDGEFWQSVGPVIPSQQDPTPSVIKVSDALQAGLAGGALKPGELLPSKRELREKFRVTGATVAAALDRLETLGLIDFNHRGVARFVGLPNSV